VHEIPTHLEVSDKLVFGLTAGQTLFCAAGVFVGYSLWRRLQMVGLPLLGSVPLAGLAGLVLILLSLIRPEGGAAPTSGVRNRSSVASHIAATLL
jgi:hypothetical protein